MNAPAIVARPFRRAAGLPLVAPLAVRDFRLVWFGEGVSLVGDQFHLIALSWLVLGLTGSGFALGMILVAAAIPRGIFMLLGGVLSDRVSPRDLALASNILRAVVTTIVAGLVLGAQVQVWHLALAGVVFGTVDAVFLPAINTLVPRLVPADRLAAANALMQGTAQLVGTVGPAIAGIAIAIIGIGAAFAVDALSFAVAAVALWFVRAGATPGRPAAPADEAGRRDRRNHPGRRRGCPDAPRPSVLELPGRGRPGRPRRTHHALDRHRVDRGEPRVHRAVVVGIPWLVANRYTGISARSACCSRRTAPGPWSGSSSPGRSRGPRRLGPVVTFLVFLIGVGLVALGLAPAFRSPGRRRLDRGHERVCERTVIAWVQGRTDPEMLGRTMSFLMLGSVVAAPLSIALAALLIDSHATAMFVAAGLLVVGSDWSRSPAGCRGR